MLDFKEKLSPDYEIAMRLDELKKILAVRSRNTIEDKNLIPAAVLLLLYKKGRTLYLIFTRRTDKVADHKGQISFPGGVQDKNDKSLEFTALREASEEIGIDVNEVEIIGVLDDCITVATNYTITPVVGMLSSPPAFTINQEEVSEIIEIPLSFLYNFFKSKKTANAPNETYIPGFPEFQYGRHTIWGATARILEQFLSLLVMVDEIL